MRTVDVLVEAHRILSDKSNWTTGLLSTLSKSGDRSCHCVMGATLRAGGCLKKSAKTERYFEANNVIVCSIRGIHSVIDPVSGACSTVDSLSKQSLDILKGLGVHVAPTQKALRYINEASHGLYGNSAWQVNDRTGYKATMKVLEVAIKNAKRRHIHGSRKAKPPVSA